MSRRAALGALVAAALTGTCVTAVAQPAPEGQELPSVARVLLLSEVPVGEATPVERRLIAELEAVGFEVEVVQIQAAGKEAARQALLQQAAFGAVAVGEDGELVARVWRLYEGELVEVPFSAAGGSPVMAGELALGVADHLHGVRLRGPDAAPPKPDDAIDASAPPSPAPRPWALRAGLGGGGSGLGMQGVLGVAGRLSPLRGLALEVEGVVSTDAGVRRAVGSSDLRLLSLRAVAAWEPWPEALVSPAVGLGAGGVLLLADGDAEAPARARLDTARVAVVVGRADVAVRLDPSLRLRLSAAVGQLLPSITLRYAGDAVASGGLVLDVMLGAEWSFGAAPRGGAG